MKPRRRQLKMLITRRGMRALIAHGLIAFGLLSAVVQLYTAIWGSQTLTWRWQTAIAVVVLSLLHGVSRAWPPSRVSRDFGTPSVRVSIVHGDLFERREHIVVGFTDTFDTDTSADRVISSRSVQGQLLDRRYDGDVRTIDDDLQFGLAETTPVTSELRKDKPHGKLDRYPIGTVAVLGSAPSRVFAVAYSRMGNNLIAKSNVHDLWLSLGKLWDSVYLNAQRAPVAMPLVGSELARINCLNRESLLKMAIMSFVARSREEVVSRELVVVIHPSDAEHVNLLEVEAFLQTI